MAVTCRFSTAKSGVKTSPHPLVAGHERQALRHAPAVMRIWMRRLPAGFAIYPAQEQAEYYAGGFPLALGRQRPSAGIEIHSAPAALE